MKNQKHLNIITSANKSKTCNFYFMCNIQMIDHFDFFLFWFRFFLFLINLNCGLCAGSFLFLWRRWTRFGSLYNNFAVIIVVVVECLCIYLFRCFLFFRFWFLFLNTIFKRQITWAKEWHGRRVLVPAIIGFVSRCSIGIGVVVAVAGCGLGFRLLRCLFFPTHTHTHTNNGESKARAICKHMCYLGLSSASSSSDASSLLCV